MTCSDNDFLKAESGCRNLLDFYLGGRPTVETFAGGSSEAVEFCQRFYRKGTILSSPTRNRIGVQFDPAIALLNHSCVPNSSYTMLDFPSVSNTEYISLVATQAIAAGQEITISYAPSTLPGDLRQEDLRCTYQIDPCGCPLCHRETIDPTWIDPRRALLCTETYKGMACEGLMRMPRESRFIMLRLPQELTIYDS